MLALLLDGLAAGATYALLALALLSVQVGWSGLRARADPEAPGPLEPIAVAALALVPTWVVRSLLIDWLERLPLAELAWVILAAAIPLLLLIWLNTGLGRIWRAVAESPRSARAIGLPLANAGLAAIALGIAAALVAGALGAAEGARGLPPPELRALVLLLALGARPMALVAAALLLGLIEGAAMLVLAPGLAELAGLALLLALLLLRPQAAHALRLERR